MWKIFNPQSPKCCSRYHQKGTRFHRSANQITILLPNKRSAYLGKWELNNEIGQGRWWFLLLQKYWVLFGKIFWLPGLLRFWKLFFVNVTKYESSVVWKWWVIGHLVRQFQFPRWFYQCDTCDRTQFNLSRPRLVFKLILASDWLGEWDLSLTNESATIWKPFKVKRESIFAVGNIGLAIGSFIGGSITGTVLIGWTTLRSDWFNSFIEEHFERYFGQKKCDVLYHGDICHFIRHSISISKSLGIHNFLDNCKNLFTS